MINSNPKLKGKKMQIKQTQCDELARLFMLGETGYSDDWEDLYLDPNTPGIEATLDTLDDFRRAARNTWQEASAAVDVPGGIYWDRVQIAKGQPRVALVVMDAGDFRLTYKQ